MLRFRSYRTRLLTAFLLLGLAALAVTAWEASAGATSALRSATYDRLTAVRETRGRQIERYFRDLGNHVLALSSDESAVTALEQFSASWNAIPLLTGPALEQHYGTTFDGLRARDPAAHRMLTEWIPADPRTRALQQLFIVQNPYPVGSRFHMLSAPAAGPYSDVHARYHPTFHRYLSAFGFYDIFLIEAGEGRIVYTVMKEVDLGIVLSRKPYRDTTLASAWRRAIALTEPETFVVEDYAPYLPSNLAPAAFFAAPIYRAGTKIGVLAIQLSIVEINRMMTADGKWAEEGLGRTGQAYIVGSDGTLRSDLREEIERPQEFLKHLQESGASPEIIDKIRRYRTAVLNLKVAPGPNKLRSQAKLGLPGLNWTVVAEIDAEEALAPVRALRLRMLWQGALVAVAFMIAAYVLAGTVTRQLRTLASGVRRLSQHDFGVRVPVESEDEIGQLASSFNRMTEDLERTTVSKEELDRMLASLINAVFVLDVGPTAAIDAVLDARIQQINNAGYDLLHCRGRAEVRMRDLVPPDNLAEWRTRIERLLVTGRLPADEATLMTSDGSPVPVLFSASWLAEQHGRKPGLVCVAQDITEWKATREKLRQKQAELQELTGRLINAQEEERSRLARELHDDFTQRLAAVAIEAGRLERIPAGDERWRAMLAGIKQHMAELSKEVHGLSRRLHPSTLDDLGLVAAIESECRAFFERGGPPVEFLPDPHIPQLPKETQLGLYRIVQEGLRNAGKHSDADQLRIYLRAGSDVELEIVDNGRGFDRNAPGWRAGLGLASMEERARLLGGSLTVTSAAGQGTRITVRVPNEETKSAAGRRP